MLKTACTNPVILAALAKGGHGDKVAVVSGNYPLERICPGVPAAYVGLRPGLPETTDVLALLRELIPIEKAEVMLEPGSPLPEVFPLYERQLGGMKLARLTKAAFYEAAASPRVCLAVSTGDVRPWANILLTIGTIRP